MLPVLRTLLFLALAGVFSTQALCGSYDDVALIVNKKSASSQAIGSYFASARSIPAQNILMIDIDTTEEITGATFDTMRGQIEDQIRANGINARLNYLVTTKGVPLKINRGNLGTTNSGSASVESELTCILGSHSGSIGGAGRLFSPVYNLNRRFDRSRDSILLVTRLDGYSVDDVRNLIDRSGPGRAVSASSVFLLDQDPDWDAVAPTLNVYLTDASAKLCAQGRSVTLNEDSVFVTNGTEILGYVSWGSNDHHANEYTSYAMPHNVWVPGAIAETYVSTSGRTFNAPDRSGQSLVADLIAEGASGAKGYVYEPFSSSMSVAPILFDRYLKGYTLAESYYMSAYYISWMDVVIGDPKTTITAEAVSLPIQLASLSASQAGTAPSVVISWRTVSETNNFGFMVERSAGTSGSYAAVTPAVVQGHGTTTAAQAYSFTDRNMTAGTYFYRLRQIDLSGEKHFSEPCAVTVRISTVVILPAAPAQFALEQNYPNPFNPATTIRFALAAKTYVRLSVYDIQGREVAVLLDGESESGNREIRFEPAGLASGTYMCRLTAGNEVREQKMIYLK